jgi:type I restriction enzyme S subunit
MTTYKIVKKEQFACNRMHVGRDYRIPIALSKEKIPFMVSPAYDVFEIIDTTVLVPEYLMMWFSRKEFDRNVWFHTDADVRGGLPWSAFCDLELPIPTPEKQQEIVREYNTIQNRIAINNQLISKLEDTAQAIYKQWFVDFEFPDENGKPYKSNGGEMVWYAELEKEIPKGWEVEQLGDIIESFSKSHSFKKDKLIFFNTSDILNGEFLHSNYMEVYEMPGQAKKQIRKGDILFSEIRPNNKRHAIVRVDGDNYVVSTKLMVLRRKNEKFSAYRLYQFLTEDSFITVLQQSAEGRSGTFPQITFEEDLEQKPFLIADSRIEEMWNKLLDSSFDLIYSKKDENQKLKELKDLLLAKMTRVEN